MNTIIIGIGEYAISTDSKDILKTFALGSCVAVIIYNVTKKAAGMIHVALPNSSVNEEKAKKNPGYFVDTGLPLLLQKMNGNLNTSKLQIKIIGGSNIMDAKGHFDIGKRNVLAIKKYLWKKGLGVIAEDIGGNISRTVSVKVKTGEIIITSKGKSWSL